jgi:Protein of unknown function (DUF1566)
MLRSIATLILALAAFSAQGALLGRAALTPGGTDYQAYYDDVLHITWLTDAKAGAGSAYDDGTSTTDGMMTWASTQAWLGSLNSSGHLGANNWRLPSVDVDGDSIVVGCGGPAACPDNEMGHHSQFNGVQFYAICGSSGLCDPGPFSNVGGSYYWSSSPAPGDNTAWVFYFPMNELASLDKATGDAAAWAVRSGDIGVVPAPAAAWLFGSAVGMLGWLRRQRSA